MGKYENADKEIFQGVGEYDIPEILPTYTLPNINQWIEFEYCKRVRRDRKDRSDIGVHFFEHDFKFEKCWTYPDRYGEMLQEFGCLLGPDFSMYVNFPKAMCIYNHYRNHWLARYWQLYYDITVIPTVMWGFKDTWDWCFDGYPKESIVAVSNVGLALDQEMKQMFEDGYKEMLTRLQPSKILFFTRNFADMPGNIQYIRWEIHKGDQLNGNR